VKVPAAQPELPCECPVSDLSRGHLQLLRKPSKGRNGQTFTTTVFFFSVNLINQNVRLELHKLNTQFYNLV